jgi:hypothetical protein
MLRSNLLSCPDKTEKQALELFEGAANVLKGARKKMASKLSKYSNSGGVGDKTKFDISHSAIRYRFGIEAASAKGISLLIISPLGLLILVYKMMNISERMLLIRAYEAVDGHCASSFFALERGQLELQEMKDMESTEL